jgi:hypothetical protein
MKGCTSTGARLPMVVGGSLGRLPMGIGESLARLPMGVGGSPARLPMGVGLGGACAPPPCSVPITPDGLYETHVQGKVLHVGDTLSTLAKTKASVGVERGLRAAEMSSAYHARRSAWDHVQGKVVRRYERAASPACG